MQECMSLDKSALESLQKQGTKIDKTIRKYCAEGKRGKAQSYAQSEGKKFMQSPKIKKIQSCSADLTKQLTINMDIVLKSNAANVCDQL